MEQMHKAEPQEEAPVDMTRKEDAYSIFHYFQQHPTMIVTAVSAIVAILSFIIHDAVVRYYNAFFDYWKIGFVYTNRNDASIVSILTFSLVYCLAMMFIHSLLAKTADAWGHCNQILFEYRWLYRYVKRFRRRLRKQKRDLLIRKLLWSRDPVQRSALAEIEGKISMLEDGIEMINGKIPLIKSVSKEFRRWIFKNIISSVIVAFLTGMAFFLMMQTTITVESLLAGLVIVGGVIVFDIIVYFGFINREISREHRKDKKNIDPEKMMEIFAEYTSHRFPLDHFVNEGAKSVVSNSSLKWILVQLACSAALICMLSPIAGTLQAKMEKTFPIYEDDTNKYAIVYHSGQSQILKAAIVDGDKLIINRSKERILEAADISYEIFTFESVTAADGGGS